MLQQIRVERFKSLVSQTLNLGRINLFIGANGSGKSNLLEAFGVIGAAASGRVDDESLLRRGVRPGVPRLYKSAFPLIDQVTDIFFKVVSDRGAAYQVALASAPKKTSSAWHYKTEKLLGKYDQVIESRNYPDPYQYNPESGLAALASARLKPKDPALQLMDALREFSIYCPSTPCLRLLVPDPQSRDPLGLAGGRLPEAVAELQAMASGEPEMAAMLDEASGLVDWCQSFSTVPTTEVPLSPTAQRSAKVIQFEDRFMSKTHNRLSGYDASEGALYVLFCAVLMLHPRSPRLIAIDNFDQVLNPRLAKALMSAICRWIGSDAVDRQWLLTAHNPAVLDGLAIGDPAMRLFAVDRDVFGHTMVVPIDLDRALALRPDSDWTLSRMWMAGLLGAVPNV